MRENRKNSFPISALPFTMFIGDACVCLFLCVRASEIGNEVEFQHCVNFSFANEPNKKEKKKETHSRAHKFS